MDFKLSKYFMRSILESTDPWECLSEDLKVKRGILLRLEELGCDRLHLFRHRRKCAGTREE
jgi:hypothetical protein